MENSTAFWCALDGLIEASEVVIDRGKGSVHPNFSEYIYPLDYGYLKDTTSMDGAGIDLWRGSLPSATLDAMMVIVDTFRRDSEIKLLLGCTEDEMAQVYRVHNAHESMKGILLRRPIKL